MTGIQPELWVVAEGAMATSSVADEHGWRVGRIVDPFGQEWEIARLLAP